MLAISLISCKLIISGEIQKILILIFCISIVRHYLIGWLEQRFLFLLFRNQPIVLRAWFAKINLSVNSVLNLPNAVKVKHFVTGAFAYHQLLLCLDELFANLANWSIYIIFTLIVDGQAQIALALLRSAVALGERRLERVKLIVKGQLFVLQDIAPGEDSY